MAHRLLRWMLNHLAPIAIRNAATLVFAERERFHWPTITQPPLAEHVVILAPHADDETIGCGGTIQQYVEQRTKVHVVILTDGALGSREIRNCDDAQQKRRLQSRLIETRRDEARRATAELGISKLHFLDAPDGHLSATDKTLLTRFGSLMNQLRPNVIFLPFLTDRHPDHWATNSCLMALRKSADFDWLDNTVCCGYEVWSPLYTNTLVDISAQMPRKLAAINHYQSQLQDVNYASGIEALNRYRAIAGLLPANHYAEAYYVASFPVYAGLYEQQHL